MKYTYTHIINDDGTPLEVEMTPEEHAETTKRIEEHVQTLRDFSKKWGEKLKEEGYVV